ncbi:AAA family ATPase [Nocardia sp. CDC153]|uniref:ATP-binding protein n=1 Tax=Nocardia sp. CDC153 TaxID=3112167 RepID=UPI002DBE03CC|nr:AAA family ATPase [Nocardia sp. CDC153]MEC3952434.1 AAA family ATPase [Nocardia sp. CDC153]
MQQDVRHQLIGRFRELDALDRLLREVRDGRSAVLVLRGDAGVGKSALLDHLAAHAADMQTVRTVGVEAEADFAYSALQRLCAPLLGHLDRLPQVHQDALRVAFGLSAGNPPEMLLVGMAVLGLLAEAASDVPLLCLIDDAQWLDLMSHRILAFVARRLDTESVAMVFAVRATDAAADEGFSGLPDLPVRGLADADARALLDSVLPGPIDARVRDRIVAETGGNPLALLELPRGLSPTELAFGFGGPGGAPLATRVEDGFRRRIDALPPDTRTLLLVAAVEPVGDGPLLWRALGLLGIGLEAAAPAEAADLITLSAPVRFRHPLVRSALWRGADAATLRAAHRALAEATDAERDPDRRAWHQAHAAVGPDAQVAAALERSADRALARGGRAAAASFLERAAALSPDRDERARRALAAAATYLAAGVPSQVPDLLAAAELSPLDRLRQAEATRLRALASYMAKPGLGAVRSLLAATAQIQDVAPASAREICLSALGAAMWTGRIEPDGLRLTVETARALPPGDDQAAAFLRAFVTWSTDGSAAAAPFLRQALDGYVADGEAGVLWLAVAAAVELGDLQTCLDITERAATTARTTGTLSLIPTSLTYRIIALIHAGRFAATRDLLAEAAAAEESMRTSASTVTPAMLGAYRGRERQALSAIEMMERDGRQRGLGRLLGVAGCARAVLHNGLGNYSAALEAARSALQFRDFALHHWALCELVEAAARVGEHAIAAEARELLAEWAETETPWAKGARALAEALTDESGAAGATERTEARYREAIDHFGHGGLGVLEARTRLLLGEWLRRRNRRAQARTELRSAHEAFVTMDMEAFAERARRELLATGETVRKRTVDAPLLTPQEAQIARLAAAGHANAEIGAELFISPRTVEWHLRKVFTKLGVSSRRELEGALPS